jgi:hypothetical protein
MSHARLPRACAAASLAFALLTLAACAPEPGAGPSSSPQAATTTPTATATPTPTTTPGPDAEVPTDCRAILSDAVLAELGDTPLNHAAFGPSGVQDDGSLVCIWADPAADTTHHTTTITGVNRGPALILLNQLADTEGFTCYTPDAGTRCEKTWQNTQYPVIDGRTLYWRDDILIDTQYSNLAPSGYTSSIIEKVFGG